MEHKTVGFAVCGSFCTHHRAMEALEAVKARYDHVIPIVSEVVADTDTRFGTAHDLMREMERICDHRVIATQKEAEPIGPKGLLDLLIIAPCTGSTLGKLACGIADTTVTLAAKAHLRNCRPILLAPSTNDGLAASARNLGQLMARKYIYLVPFRQDDPEEKPASLVADFSLVADAAQAALEGRRRFSSRGPRPAISARKSMEHGTSLCYTVGKARMSCLPSGTGRTRRSLTWIAA